MRRLIFAVVVLAVLAVGVFWVLPAARYDDLEAGSLQWSAPHGKYVFGQLTPLGVSVRNSGSRDVRITRVGEEPGTRMSPNEFQSEHMLPFAAFTLHPGQERYLVINVRLPPCRDFAAGTSAVIGTFPVRSHVLVFNHQQDIALGAPVKFARGKTCAA